MVTVALHAALGSHQGALCGALAARNLDSVDVDGDAPLVIQRAAASPSIEAVIVLEARLEDPSEADTLRAIADATEARPELAVVLLGSTDADVDMLVALASGVAGYLPAEASPSEVADAVVAVLAGAIVAPPKVTGPLVRSLRTGSRRMMVSDRSSRLVALTAREWEVLVLLRQGRTTGEMARRMVVAPVTVRSHVAALVAKFGVHSRDDLTGH